MHEPMNVKWVGRAAFAEVAEALGAETDRVFAAMPKDGLVWALWADDEDDMQTSILERDRSGILRVCETTPTGETAEEFMRSVIDR